MPRLKGGSSALTWLRRAGRGARLSRAIQNFSFTRRAVATVLLVAFMSDADASLNPGPDDVYVRIVDTGPGLCTITRIPSDPQPYFMVYDAGHWNGHHCRDAVREVVGSSYIDLFIISHSDADHLGQAVAILDEYRVANVITTGERRETASWKNMNAAIAAQAANDASIMNLQTSQLIPGTTLSLGDATITLLAGWGEWSGSGPTSSERRNVISIVAKLEYGDGSVLFTGDTVGRRLGDPTSACKDAEKVMVDRHATYPLKADVLIAPHHGGNNGSAACFIGAVDPRFVIFPSGHDHEHPSDGAAQRYVAHGVPLTNILRTDRGDDEPGAFEWKNGETVDGCADPAGDDDVEIVIRRTGPPLVAYRNGATGECESQ